MMTLSGRYIGRETGAPSIEDIALGLSRMPRFAGQTLFEWTVADHVVVCARYMRALITSAMYTVYYTPLLELHALLHDAHEALTGDIPTTFKTDDMRALQRQLDVRLYASLDLPMPTPSEAAYIKEADAHMLVAEARVCTPDATYQRILREREEYSAWPTAVRVIEEYLHEDHNPLVAFHTLAVELLANAYFGPVGV